MTPAQTSVLLWLSRQPEGARAPDIARGSKTSGDNVRRVLASLTRDGLVAFAGPQRSNVGRWCVIERLAATTASVDEARRRGQAEIRRRQDRGRLRRSCQAHRDVAEERSMITNVAFTVPGEPQGKGRARVGSIGGRARMFTPAKTVAYEGLIAHAAQLAMRGAAPLDGDCRLEVDIICTVPASWSAKKRTQALAGSIRPAKKPDSDNVLKAVCDGMNGVVWRDDVQAVEGGWRKVYGVTPGLHVRVASLEVRP